MTAEEAILWLLLITWACNALFGGSSRKRAARPKEKGIIRTIVEKREETRAKRILAEDRRRYAEKKRRKEHRARMRAEGKLRGKWWNILID